ncbi:MAG: PQQ-like beta-propeller repeat protein [Kiritimatiellae bacterium]|jgi:outer membrane protein assembly factor BamB|nr:PQQ-like beta-propeller repeat protein [Kiritimatiellia bacterium]
MKNTFHIPLSTFHNFLHALCALLFAVSASAVAETWPQFRGPNGDGLASAKGLPTEWSETKNITWKTAIPGKGHSSPVILQDQIWLTTALNKGKSRNVLTVDYVTGKIIRNKTLFTVEEPEKCHKGNSYATPTPVLEEDRIYVTFGPAGTACLSSETGEVIWQRTDFKVTYWDVGAASSPTLYRDKLIMICDGDNGSERFVTALDKMTGKTIWRSDRVYTAEQLKHMVHSSCIPHVITVAGKDQIICPGGKMVTAYDPETGNEIWTVKYNSWSVVPRPLYADGLLYICAGVIKPIMLCINPAGAKGDITGTKHIIWQTKKMVPNMPSPLYINKRFYTMTSAKLACRKPKTGEIIWNERIPGQHESSPVSAEGNIYLFNKTGGSMVVKASDDFQAISTNKLESGCWASPAIIDKSLILRTKTHLYRIEE